ncbi:ABC transporter ATP-binding protein [Bacillus horti]|uniref:ABC transport system ATP-binding protein n=1 Tax=Caldalkalibacillus horti TaxID=77523 RepID=A0ABT9VV68_9BACI|nr:ABC transporter ATP-binding protein [Bacillus horti]MDQ0164779.1 putative ABC transport system ATP-binding protein [Bacillus horti]
MISLKNIKKKYRGQGVETLALDGVNLDIEKSEFLCIRGRSGCGKTTLLNILGCMDQFDSGEYIFEGVDVTSMKAREVANFRNTRLGFVFQSFHLIDDLKAWENVEVPLGYAGVRASDRKRKALDLLDMVGLSNRIHHYPSQLSGGQQQRVAIARALANAPSLILADEPTGNLDSTNGKEIMELLTLLNQNGTTIVMVTHDQVVADFAKRSIELEDGKVIFDQ